MDRALVDTGDSTQTGGRLKRVAPYLRAEEPFCFTYGDGLANVDVRASIDFHNAHGKLATITAVLPPGRFGAIERRGAVVSGFTEKPRGDGGLINGGFFVLSAECLQLIDSDDTAWEARPLSLLAERGEMCAFEHHGFWQPMDTLREKNLLEDLWASGRAPWKVWT